MILSKTKFFNIIDGIDVEHFSLVSKIGTAYYGSNRHFYDVVIKDDRTDVEYKCAFYETHCVGGHTTEHNGVLNYNGAPPNYVRHLCTPYIGKDDDSLVVFNSSKRNGA